MSGLAVTLYRQLLKSVRSVSAAGLPCTGVVGLPDARHILNPCEFLATAFRGRGIGEHAAGDAGAMNGRHCLRYSMSQRVPHTVCSDALLISCSPTSQTLFMQCACFHASSPCCQHARSTHERCAAACANARSSLLRCVLIPHVLLRVIPAACCCAPTRCFASPWRHHTRSCRRCVRGATCSRVGALLLLLVGKRSLTS
jgi:hypothetical protein